MQGHEPIVFENIDPEQLMTLHREMFEYWSSKSLNGLLPSRSDIDPLDFPNVLPWILLLDVVRGGTKPRAQFRLFGTGLVERAGRDLTGLWLESAFPDDQRREYFFDAIDRVIEERRPIGYFGHSMMEFRHHIRICGLLLPLSENGHDVDMIIGINLRQKIDPDLV